jgi:hypothetical protein
MSASLPSYVYRPMTPADLPAAHALSVQLKWPHRLDDWAMLQRGQQRLCRARWRASDRYGVRLSPR